MAASRGIMGFVKHGVLDTMYVSLLRDDYTQFSEFNSSHKDFPHSKPVPIGSLSEILVGVLILQAVDEGLIQLHDPITKYLPYLSIEEVDYSLHLVTIKNLLTHSSGIGQIDRPMSLMRRGREIWSDNIQFVDQRKLYHKSVKTVVHPDLQYINSIHNYGILSALLEQLYGRSIRSLMTSLLHRIDPTLEPFNPDQIQHSVGFGPELGKHTVKPLFTKLYGTRHVMLSINQLETVLSRLFFSDSVLSVTSQQILNSALFKINESMDQIGLSLRYRASVSPLLMKSSNWNGYFLKIIILPEFNTLYTFVSNTIIPNLEKYSNYLANILLEKYLGIEIRPEMNPMPTELIENFEIEGKFRIAKYNPLIPGLLQQNGLEVLLMQKKDTFLITDQLAGLYRSHITRPRQLEVLDIDGDRITLGFWDFLGYQKIIIPSRKEPALIYADIEGPALLFNSNKDPRPLRFNLLLHWHYFKNDLFLPNLIMMPRRIRESVLIIADTFGWIGTSLILNLGVIMPKLKQWGRYIRTASRRLLIALQKYGHRVNIALLKALYRFDAWFIPKYHRSVAVGRSALLRIISELKYSISAFYGQGKLRMISLTPILKQRIPLPWHRIDQFGKNLTNNYRARRRQIRIIRSKNPSYFTLDRDGAKKMGRILRRKLSIRFSKTENQFVNASSQILRKIHNKMKSSRTTPS